jgi:hypothetical protein
MAEQSTIKIKELNLDIIPPFSNKFEDPDYKGGVKLVVVGKPGCFAPDTEVLMYDGNIKKVQDVQVGDELMGDDNTPRVVQELYHDTEEMFEIKPNKGDSYTVNLKHDLVLECKGERTIVSVRDYLENPLQNGWKLVRSSGINWDYQEVSIDPYDLGLWLGSDTPILIPFLNTYNLVDNKHIPFQFKINTREVRLLLLAGIIDSESYIYDNKIELFQCKKRLADDILFLVRSLGFGGTIKVFSNPKNPLSTFYKISIYGRGLSDIPTKITKNHFIEETENHLLTTFKVIPKGEGEYYGFSLDQNRLFLLKSCDIVKNTGKSTLIKSLLYAKKHIFPVGIAMNGTEDTNHMYKSFMPSTFVFNEYREDKIEDLIKRQKIAMQHLPNPWAVLIVDDCTEDTTIFNKPLQVGLYKKGRHWSLMYILALQYAMDVRANIRTSIDGVFILREPLLKNRRTLYENYASVVPDFEMFCALMDQLTDNYSAMYIHNFTTSNNWQDCVFWYKAKPPPEDWKFGCPEYWEFHESRYNEEYTEPVE